MKAEISGDEIKITECFLCKESIKEIAGRRYDPATKAWYVPNSPENSSLLSIFGAEFDESAEMPKDAGITIVDELPIIGMPIKAIPYRHQIAAFNFALRILGGAK